MTSMFRPGPSLEKAGLENIADTAERAVEFAMRYQTPLTPAVYHVWYTYCQRENGAINDAIDLAMNTGEVMTEVSLTELYESHIAQRTISEDLHEIGKTLHSALGEASEAMEDNLEDSSSFSGTLRTMKQSLVIGTSKREVSEIITKLHKANRLHIASAQRMTLQMGKNRNMVSKLEKELVEIKRAANTDYLTKLANRRRLDDMLDEAMFVAREKSQPVSFAIGDIDGLEVINKKWGHSAGDNVMRVYAAELQKCLSGGQLPARFAGAKFALLLPNIIGQSGVAITEKVRASFKNIDWVTEEAGEDIGRLTVSFGVTEMRKGDTRERLVNRADRLLMEAKNAGRDRVNYG